jgi:sugar lactone lactonase YvrE
MLIADSGNNRVRVAAAATGTLYGHPVTAGNLYTIAGNGTAGFSGDTGPAASAELQEPGGVAVDTVGNLLIADSINARIRVVAAKAGTFYGQAMTAGNIYTVAGNGTAGFSGDGGPATSAELFFPEDVAADRAGNLVIADAANKRVRVVAEQTGTFYGKAMTTENIYTIVGKRTKGYNGDNRPAAKARLNDPNGVAVNAAGNLLIADTGNLRIRMITR